jgi:hypothetical protein
MLHSEALLDTLPFEVRHFSSWARNGSDSDMGWYQGSAGGGWYVLCDVSGPGVMAEFWCTREPLSDTCRLRIFVDDTTQAVIDTSLRRLLGSVPPFIEPLADSAMHARYSFVPVPFQTRLKVHYRGASLYYHVNVLTLGGGQCGAVHHAALGLLSGAARFSARTVPASRTTGGMEHSDGAACRQLQYSLTSCHREPRGLLRQRRQPQALSVH